MATEFQDIPASAIALNRNSENKVQEREIAFNENNYLNTKLTPEDKGKKELRIRLLPMDMTTGNPFLKIYQHNVKVPTEVSKSGYKSYICLKKANIDHSVFGDNCPFCKINADAYAMAQTEPDPNKKKTLTQLSLANRAREGVICRCIDRDHPEHGVKFWKFNISLKEDDPYNQIMNLWESRMKEGEQVGQNINILSLREGYDLIVTITQGGENTKGNTISITDAKFPSPLSQDPEQAKAWIYDSKRWDEVFKVKPYDYLEVISVGEVPWFNRTTGKWIPKSEYDAANNTRKVEQSQTVAEADASFRQPINDYASNFEVPNMIEDMPF